MSTRLIEALCSPAAFGHPVEDVRVIETHISWVILTGLFAYKIKRPVDLGFVDFTSLERRQFYCQEELRLNGRLAPQLYLGVVPITGTPEAPSMGGMGSAIEFAVQMHEFPQEALLSEVLKRQEVEPAHIDALAHELADFHGRIAVAAADAPFGTCQSIERAMDENLEHLLGDQPQDSQPQDKGAVQHLKDWCQHEFETRQDEFRHRRQSGYIRECHGDMHLGNMLLLDNRPVIFDCIEFNDEFRWIDVMSELAFTVMDLEDRGSPGLARRLLNAYLEQTGDYAGLMVLRYYLVYRALVRAKVADIRLRQSDVGAEEQSRIVAEYRSYLELAQRYARPPGPRLIITHGPSGSGKTTMAQPLLEAVGAVRVRSDVERKRLFGLQSLDRTDAEVGGGIYAADATQRTYARLAELASYVLLAGFSVIVDATFLKREQRQQFRRLADELKVPFAILDFQVAESTLRDRVAQRASEHHDASEADLSVLEEQLKSREPLDAEECRRAIRASSEQGGFPRS
jgi:aminoglycoside phosphotransferase family enzyme/predicted kinase